jgi:hypothetical protein
MRPKPVAYFLCVAALALIAVCPLMLLSSHHEAEQAAPYKGILKLRHITEWRTGGASFESYLKARIKTFEANYAYAFIEIESLTAEEAAEALAAGQSPDLISYPMGHNPGVALADLPAAETVLLNTGENAYPYACGGYCILVNTDLLTKQNAEIPESGWGIRPEALLSAAQYGAVFDAELGCCALPALAMHEYPESDEPSYSAWGEPEPPDALLSLSPQSLSDGLTAFMKDEAAVMIASQRQLYEAEQAFLQGKGPSFFAYAVGGYTDMVQMIGVAPTDDKKKLSACTTFAQMLLSRSAQRKLETLGVLPVIPDLEVYAEDECRRTMYALLCESAALPSGDAQELYNLAARAASGDKGALKTLRTKLHC